MTVPIGFTERLWFVGKLVQFSFSQTHLVPADPLVGQLHHCSITCHLWLSKSSNKTEKWQHREGDSTKTNKIRDFGSLSFIFATHVAQHVEHLRWRLMMWCVLIAPALWSRCDRSAGQTVTQHRASSRHSTTQLYKRHAGCGTSDSMHATQGQSKATRKWHSTEQRLKNKIFVEGERKEEEEEAKNLPNIQPENRIVQVTSGHSQRVLVRGGGEHQRAMIVTVHPSPSTSEP